MPGPPPALALVLPIPAIVPPPAMLVPAAAHPANPPTLYHTPDVQFLDSSNFSYSSLIRDSDFFPFKDRIEVNAVFISTILN